MVRRAARVDENQSEIIDALRRVGAVVQPLHGVGEGCPDILVGWAGLNHLIEIKRQLGPKGGGGGSLTSPQRLWHKKWGGTVGVVRTPAEALLWIGYGSEGA